MLHNGDYFVLEKLKTNVITMVYVSVSVQICFCTVRTYLQFFSLLDSAVRLLFVSSTNSAFFA